MKSNFLAFVLIFVIGVLAEGQDKAGSLHQLEVDVVFLSSDYLKGRQAGTEGERIAAEYIARRMAAMGLVAIDEDADYLQPFEFKTTPNPHTPNRNEKPLEGTGHNVVGYLDMGADRTVIIGGHYDHLGMGIAGSLHAQGPAIHNGADDNASGVAAMLYLAKMLESRKDLKTNYLFIAFSGEEMGLFGSKYYVQHALKPLEEVSYMINMDMIGRLEPAKKLVVMGTGTSPNWEKIINNTQAHGIQTVWKPSGIGPTDFTSFYLQDIPALSFFTGQHEDYHKPSDDAALVNFEGLYEVADFIYLLIELAAAEKEIVFSKTKEENDPHGSTGARSFAVTLGVMPDYVYQGDGMRIDGVRPGRPAAKGGIEDGDVLIEVGGEEISDIYKYMEVLKKYQTGDTVEVKVLRDKKTVDLSVTF